MRLKTSRTRGFTIIEMLVVICIITVLVSLLLPGVSKLRSMALGIKCQGNIHSLTAAFLVFAADHDQQLPGADRTYWNPLPYQNDWLMNPQTSDLSSAPQTGTVYPYINNMQVYLCPAMDADRNTINGSNSGADEFASNGKFDYGFFTEFNGAPIRTIPQRSQLLSLSSAVLGWYPTPIICQEDGFQINGTYNQEGNHSNDDQMSHIHNGGSYYGAIDGSVNFVIEPDIEGGANGCWQWATMTPLSHRMLTLGNGASGTYYEPNGTPHTYGGSYGPWGSWVQQ